MSAESVSTDPYPSRFCGTGEATDYVQVVGNAAAARVLTTTRPDMNWGKGSTYEVTGELPGAVTVDPDGSVRVECPCLAAATCETLARDFGRELRDAKIINPEPGRRYRTAHYVCLDAVEARRLAAVDGTSPDAIRVDAAEVVHAGASYVVWSDGKITGAAGLPRWTTKIRALSEEASRLVESCRGSDSGAPEIGYATLLRVQSIAESTEVESAPGGGAYAAPRVRRLVLELTGGELETVYEHTYGYPEGYVYELTRERPTIGDGIGAVEAWHEAERRYADYADSLEDS